TRTFGSAWQQAGYPGEIPAPATIVNVLDFGAAGNGVTNDQPAATAAIAALGGGPGVVYFPAGTYLLQSTLYVPAGVVLRGERSETTVLRADHLGSVIYIASAQSGVFQPVISGYTIHSTNLVVTDGSGFAPGDYAEIREDNDPAWGITFGAKVVGQLLRITAVAGNTLTLERPLRLTYVAGQNPEIRKITPITEVGIENLKVERLLAGTDPVQRNNVYTIDFQYAARCWVRGVEGYNTFGGHLALVYSTEIEVTGCYIHHAHEYDGGGSGYGVRLEFKTGECLIENNIFNHLRHSMLVQAGVNGNVFGYNYSREPTRSEFPAEISSDITLHGNYPYANLYEGNVCQHIWIDASHGANGPLNTFFRNRAEDYGFNMTDGLANNQNVVGNETFQGTWSAFVGDGYRLLGSGHFEYGNNTEADGVQPPGTTSLTDYSYYLNADPSQAPATPAFWNIADPLPTIGLPQDLATVKNIPARARYVAGGPYTVGPPSLARQPTNQTVAAGQTATFTVQATGTPQARYQWRKDTGALTDATNAVLAIAAAQPGDAGQYDVVITDDYGSVPSAAASLTVTEIDTVGDGIPDWWRAQHFGGDGQTTNASSCAGCDADTDGLTNEEEYSASTDPTSKGSRLAIVNIAPAGADTQITWIGGTSAWQYLEYRDDLDAAGGPWTGLFTNSPPTAITNAVLHPGTATATNLFYRVRARP
ncbi:immunoglobulin domain-containing protein, partial [bacterium]|nr:immunoglobulin domain-containing protein [bacterium]